MGEDNREHLYKVLVIGEFGVGKTSIIRRYTEGVFSTNYKLTIGVDFALKVIHWDEGTKINLQLWDVAGHERFGHMTRVYYKYAIAAIIVYDISRPATFEAVLKWFKDINRKVMLTNENPIPVLLLANKCDIEEYKVDAEKLNQFCFDNGFIGWFQTSAKEDTNIDNALLYLVQTILSLSGDCAKPAMKDISASNGQAFSLHDDLDYKYGSGYMSDFKYTQANISYNASTKKKICCFSN